VPDPSPGSIDDPQGGKRENHDPDQKKYLPSPPKKGPQTHAPERARAHHKEVLHNVGIAAARGIVEQRAARAVLCRAATDPRAAHAGRRATVVAEIKQ
jgi:hypothetical protein